MSSLPSSLPRRRVATWWTSDAARDRQRLIPPWIALGFGALVAVGLALLFPFRGLEADLGRAASRPDALQIAYLETWLTVRPDRSALRYQLAQQLIEADDLARARVHLARLAAADEPRLRERAQLLDLDIGWRELQALSPGHPDRPARAEALRERLRVLLAADVALDIGAELAQRAAQVGAVELAVAWYERLLARRPALPAATWESAAADALRWGEHRLAARLLMQGRGAASTLAEQRRLFIAALRALQAANLYDEALALAEQHLGALAGDTSTLEFLTRFALAANRPEVAQRYAILMLRIALLPEAIARLQLAGTPVPPAWQALAARIVAHARPAQATSSTDAGGHERTARLPFDDALYTLSYDVFIANANLRDALVVARSAVRQVPRSLAWRRRLAQVAEWSGQPALALEQWHAIARQTGEREAWAEVRWRAQQLRASDLWVEALEATLAGRRDDPTAVRELARAYEAIGRPEEALAALRPALAERGRSGDRRERLELLAAVAERVGDLDLQRAALAALLRDFGAGPDTALRLASLEYGVGNEAAALAALRGVLPEAAADVARHRDFWLAYAELSRARGQRAEALRAYRLLLSAGGAPEDVLVNTAVLLEDDDPREAARLYELAWQRYGRTEYATQLLYLLQRDGENAAMRDWLARLTPAQRRQLERDARFLVQRATLRLAEGDVRGARADAERAFALQPTDPANEALLVWALIAARDAPALRARLAASAHASGDEPLLWGPFAAGWLALQEPRQAVRYLRLQAKGGSDPLWMLSYADALDQLGSRELAWAVRAHAWRQRAKLAAAARTPQAQIDLQRRLVPLAATLVGGDAARARLHALLAVDPQARRSPTREAALAYWIAREHSEIAAAWLLGQYAQSSERPVWAELSVALAENDGARLETLLDTVADWLPVYDRIEAADRVGRTAAAQSLAFDTLAVLPDSDELHRRLVDRVAGERSATAPQFVGAQWRSFRQRPLEETGTRVDASLRLSPRIALGAAWSQAARRSTDAAQLVDPPRHDTTMQLDVGYDLGQEASVRVGVQQREALARETGWRAQGEARVHPRLSLALNAGQGQPATDNAFLRVGAVRDVLSLAANARLSQREFVAATVETSRFAAQGGGAIGSGRVVRLEAGHALRTEYPDLSLRASFADLHYAPDAGVAGALLPLLPPAARAGATNATLLPVSTQQIGLTLVAGETARERYTRGWRPFGVLGVTDDRNSGRDYAWTLGAGGSLFGGDELSLYAAGGSGLGTQAASFRELGLRYRWMF